MKSSEAMQWSNQSPHMSPNKCISWYGHVMRREETHVEKRNNDEGGREETSRKAQTEPRGGWTECGAIWDTTSSIQNSHRTETDGRKQSWRSTPGREDRQRWATVSKLAGLRVRFRVMILVTHMVEFISPLCLCNCVNYPHLICGYIIT